MIKFYKTEDLFYEVNTFGKNILNESKKLILQHFGEFMKNKEYSISCIEKARYDFLLERRLPQDIILYNYNNGVLELFWNEEKYDCFGKAKEVK